MYVQLGASKPEQLACYDSAAHVRGSLDEAPLKLSSYWFWCLARAAAHAFS